MSGTIGVKSTLGVGSTFWFSATFANARAGQTGRSPGQDAKTPHPTATAQPRRKDHILVVEDSSANRKVALWQLDKLGYVGEPVGNGREAIDAVARVPFDLVLMDCRMPEMDGYEATRRIRQREGASSHIPIVAMTAHAFAGDQQKCRDAGMDDYISKPVEIENLAAVLARVLGGQTKAASAAPAEDVRNGADRLEGAQEPALDAVMMTSLRAQEGLLGGLIETVLKEIPEQLQEIAEAIAGANGETAAIAAHSLKGTAAIFGARRMQNCAAGLELAADGGSKEKALFQLELLRTECDRVLRELETERARPAL